jgi:hypothetical protein
MEELSPNVNEKGDYQMFFMCQNVQWITKFKIYLMHYVYGKVHRARFIGMKVPQAKVECEPNPHKAYPQKLYMT